MHHRFGAHQFIWKSHWTDRDAGVLDQAKSLGCDVFEFSWGDDVDFNLASVRRHADAIGLELTLSPGNAWPVECNLDSDDPLHQRQGLAWHRAMIERAAEIGAVAYCGAIYSRPGHVLRRAPPPEEMPRVAAHLHTLAEYARSIGIALVMEPMSRFRNHLVNTSGQAMKLITLADHPNLKVNLDTYHMITEERDYGAAIRRCLPVLWGIHACENDRGVPGGGLVPWSDVFGALHESSHPLRILLETYHTGPSGFGFERGIFQNICPDAEAFVRDGLSFLRAHV